MPLPELKLHPIPFETGFIEISDSSHHCCGTVIGYISTGTVITQENFDVYNRSWLRNRDIATLLPETNRHQGDLL